MKKENKLYTGHNRLLLYWPSSAATTCLFVLVICATHTYVTHFYQHPITLLLFSTCGRNKKSSGGNGAGLPTVRAFTQSPCLRLSRFNIHLSQSLFHYHYNPPARRTRNWFYATRLNNGREIAEEGKSWQHENKGRVMGGVGGGGGKSINKGCVKGGWSVMEVE